MTDSGTQSLFDSLFSAEQRRAISALSSWSGEDADGRVQTVAEDPSIVDYVPIVLDALAGLVDSEVEWQRRGDRALAAETRAEVLMAAVREAREFIEAARPLLGIGYGNSLGARADALYVKLAEAIGA